MESRAQGAKPKEEDAKLPRSTRALEEYLPNTVWDLKGPGVFRFRGDGTMAMPLHDFKWKATGPRTADMFTQDWHWVIKFSEDMKTLEVPGRYNGVYVKRVISMYPDKRLEEIMVASPWTHISKDGSFPITFGTHGKITANDQGWKSWVLLDGLFVIKGTKEGKDIKQEFFLLEDKKPYTLKWADGGGDDRPKLEQK